MNRFNKMLLSCGILAVLVGSACGGAPSTAESTADLSTCDSWGYYTCPSDGADFEYAPPFCGAMLKTTAHSRCEAYCPVTCRDSGWFN